MGNLGCNISRNFYRYNKRFLRPEGGQRSIHVRKPGLAVRHIREGGMRAEPIVGVTISHVQNFALARRGMLAQYCPPVQPDCAEQQSLAL